MFSFNAMIDTKVQFRKQKLLYILSRNKTVQDWNSGLWLQVHSGKSLAVIQRSGSGSYSWALLQLLSLLPSTHSWWQMIESNVQLLLRVTSIGANSHPYPIFCNFCASNQQNQRFGEMDFSFLMSMCEIPLYPLLGDSDLH